jgi:hypothetical protein
MGNFMSSTMEKRYGETRFIAVAELMFRSGMCTQNINLFEEETVHQLASKLS